MSPSAPDPRLPAAFGHYRAGQHREAALLCRQILADQPKQLAALQLLGALAAMDNRHDEAIDLMRRTIALEPNSADSYVNLGGVLFLKGDYPEAIRCYGRALALQPNHPKAQITLDQTLDRLLQSAIEQHRAGRIDQADAIFRQTFELCPENLTALGNLGSAFYRRGRVDEAVACFRKVLVATPANAEPHVHLALALLLRGDLIEGFREYVWRWQHKGFTLNPRDLVQPQWDGSPLAGRTILLHAEQGLGDAMNFIRYEPLVARCGGTIIVETYPALFRLFRSSFPNQHTVQRGQPLPRFDVHCPLMTLPAIFGTTLDTIPQQTPLLRADDAIIERWRTRIARNDDSMHVGLAWAGSKTHHDDRNRSLRLADLAPLGNVPSVTFHSLQKGDQAVDVFTPPAGMRIRDWSNDIADFADTAGLAANLDLVISVDTSVAHLAGSIGKPVWTLLPFAPDWRWLQGREETSWYPTMRLFRQPTYGDWPSVIARVASLLREGKPSLQAHSLRRESS